MESRFKDLLLKNEAKKRHLPGSLTSEIEAAQERLGNGVNSIPSYNQTRELVLQRLGGPFDYAQFAEEIRRCKVEREQLTREFKRSSIKKPELGIQDFDGKKAFYDFSTRPLIEREFNPTEDNQTTVSYEKPKYLADMVSEAPVFMLQDI